MGERVVSAVLLVGAVERTGSFEGQFHAKGWSVDVVEPAELASRIDALAGRIVVVAGDAQDVAAGVLQARQAGPSVPVLAVLSPGDTAGRDRCLVRGATDVLWDEPGVDLADAAARAAGRWVRDPQRRPMRATFAAQRGRETFRLAVLEVDGTGLVAGLPDQVRVGELLRLSMPLPDGELIVWGRGDEADGRRGLRFVGLTDPERQRLLRAVTAGRRPSAPPAQPAASAPVTTPVSSPPPVPASTEAPVDAAPAVPADDEPATSPGTDSAETASEPTEGEALPDEADVEDEPGEAAEPLPVWPDRAFDAEATREALSAAAQAGLAAQIEGAPSPSELLAFVRTLSPAERKAFEDEPPADLVEPALHARALILRLTLWVYSQEARAVAARGERVLVDAAALDAISRDVRALNDAFQKAAGLLLTNADPHALRELSQMRNAVTRGHDELKSAVAALKGEAHETRPAVLLDVDEAAPGASTPPKREAKATASEQPKQPEFVPPFKRRERSRTTKAIASALVVIAGVAALYFGMPAGPKYLSLEMFESVPGVRQALIQPGGARQAMLIVDSNWQQSPQTVARAAQIVEKADARRLLVLDGSNRVLASGAVAVLKNPKPDAPAPASRAASPR